jgi:hypothetical protein
LVLNKFPYDVAESSEAGMHSEPSSSSNAMSSTVSGVQQVQARDVSHLEPSSSSPAPSTQPPRPPTLRPPQAYLILVQYNTSILILIK